MRHLRRGDLAGWWQGQGLPRGRGGAGPGRPRPSGCCWRSCLVNGTFLPHRRRSPGRLTNSGAPAAAGGVVQGPLLLLIFFREPRAPLQHGFKLICDVWREFAGESLPRLLQVIVVVVASQGGEGGRRVLQLQAALLLAEALRRLVRQEEP